MQKNKKSNLELMLSANLPKKISSYVKGALGAAALMAATPSIGATPQVVVMWDNDSAQTNQYFSYGPVYKSNPAQYPYRILLGSEIRSYTVTLPDTSANFTGKYYFTVSDVNSGVEDGKVDLPCAVITRGNLVNRMDGSQVNQWTTSNQATGASVQADGTVSLESAIAGDVTVTFPLHHAQSGPIGSAVVSNPYLVVEATAVGTAPMSIELLVTDATGKTAAFTPKYQLRTDVPNLVIADLSKPSMVTLGFDKTAMRSVELNVYSPNSQLSSSGANKVFVKRVDAIDSRNVLMSGNFVPSTNTYSAGNFGVFGDDSVGNVEVKNISEMKGQGIGSTYLTKSAVMTTTMPAVAAGKEVAFQYTMSQAELSRLPLSGTAIEVSMGSNLYQIPASQVVNGVNANLFVLQSSVAANAQMSVKVYQRTYLPRTTPGVPLLKQMVAYILPQ